jgi:hypothetical protein
VKIRPEYILNGGVTKYIIFLEVIKEGWNISFFIDEWEKGDIDSSS